MELFAAVKRILFPRGVRQATASVLLLVAASVAAIVLAAPLMRAHEAKSAFFPLIFFIVMATTLFFSLAFFVIATFPRYNQWIASVFYLSMWGITVGWVIWLFLIAYV
jgi:hypothetical protein